MVTKLPRFLIQTTLKIKMAVLKTTVLVKLILFQLQNFIAELLLVKINL